MLSPLRVRRILPSVPSTLPIWACSKLAPSGIQPACRATAKTIRKCSAWAEPTT